MQLAQVVVLLLLCTLVPSSTPADSVLPAAEESRFQSPAWSSAAAATPSQPEPSAAAAAWGQSPWLDGYAPAPPQASGARAPSSSSSSSRSSGDSGTNLPFTQLTVAEAEAILQQATEAAGQGGWDAGEEDEDEEEEDDDEPGVQPPYVVYLSSSAASAAEAALGSDVDAAAFQFVGVSSSEELQQTLAPPYVMPALSAPAPAPAQPAAAAAPAPAAAAARPPGASGAGHTPMPAMAPAPTAAGLGYVPAPSAVATTAAAAPAVDGGGADAAAALQWESGAPMTAAPIAVAEALLPDLGLTEALDLAPAPSHAPLAAVSLPPMKVMLQGGLMQDGQLALQRQRQEQQHQQQPPQPPQHQQQHTRAQQMPAAIMGKGKHLDKGAAFPTEPEIPVSHDAGPAAFCDPRWGLQPTQDGRCICMPGFGTNLDMRTCARCPVGWYSRGGQVGVAYCKPCPQLSTSNPGRTACVQKESVIRPNVPASLCEPCRLPNQPFTPPQCCPKGQVCCGNFGCCTTKRCINNETTNNQPRCCGDDCSTGSVGSSLKCCDSGEICVNTSSGATSQLCCNPTRVCGQQNSKSCCSANEFCCNNRDCCNPATQACFENVYSGAPQNQSRCCRLGQVNCNGICCSTGTNPATQQCFIDQKGQIGCCENDRVCPSPAENLINCCNSQEVCASVTSSAGIPQFRCCLAGYQLCAKNNYQPVCCVTGKCPPVDTADFCLA